MGIDELEGGRSSTVGELAVAATGVFRAKNRLQQISFSQVTYSRFDMKKVECLLGRVILKDQLI